MTWLSGWQYRRFHLIVGSAEKAVVDYQIRIKVHYGAGEDDAENVYLNGNCNNDFSDIRFTKADGSTELEYWIEKKTDGDIAYIWVLLDEIPISPNTKKIYIYYKKTVASTSNGYKVFPLLDDAEHVPIPDMEDYGLYTGTNPVIPCGGGAASDKYMRELGNILYEPDEPTRKYKTFYTGYNAGASVDEKIHYAYSENGINWTKSASNPVINNRRAEDPYVIKIDDTYYLFAEDKQGGGTEIRRWHSSDCETWIDDGVVLSTSAEIWENKHVASPCVWIEGDTWYMLYEAIGLPPHEWGELALASSSDGLEWVKDENNPLFDYLDTYNLWVDTEESVVINDIIKIGDTYYITYHGRLPSNYWALGVASSTDKINWTDSNKSPMYSDYLDHISHTGAMFFHDTEYVIFYINRDDSIPSDVLGIYRGYPKISNWIVQGDGSAKPDATHKYGKASEKMDGDPNSIKLLKPLSPTSNILHWSVYYTKGAGWGHSMYHGNGTKLVNFGLADNIGADNLFWQDDGGKHSIAEVGNGWHTIEAKNINWGAFTYDIYVDDILKKTGAIMRTNAGQENQIQIFEQGQTVWVDNVFVRQYVDPEPTHGAWGGEEEEAVQGSSGGSVLIWLKTP